MFGVKTVCEAYRLTALIIWPGKYAKYIRNRVGREMFSQRLEKWRNLAKILICPKDFYEIKYFS